MARPFESFVILADMRTGSNALEERLNAFDGITCHGEVFNPHFIGHDGQDRLLGVDLAGRDADPRGMLRALRSAGGVSGFRLFSDHDRRAFDLCLKDSACAKVVLTRDPLDSYVSLKIARKTGQWWMSDLRSAKSGKATFEIDEFERYLSARADWHRTIRNGLQATAQAAFEIDYADLGDEAVIRGLVRYLGAKDDTARTPERRGRVQNPAPLSERVANFAEMRAALRDRDPFDLDHLPDHEPARGPNVPAFVTARRAPLLYMPVKCADDLRVTAWMAALDGVERETLETGFTRKTLRQWKRRQGPHRSFTVVSHPVVRAHDAFCRFVLPIGPASFTGIRSALVRSYKVPLPEDPEDAGYGPEAHHAAFLAFLKFLKGNLSGQTALRVDGAWASLEASLRGLAAFAAPDAVLRGETLESDLPALVERFGVAAPAVPEAEPTGPFPLAEIYDAKIENAARAAYQRDYMMFGFGAWR